MRKYKAFTITELILATMFLGIIMALILPNVGKGVIVNKNKTAYKTAFEQVKNAASEAMIVDAKENSGQKLWQLLDRNMPVIGYAKGGTKLSQSTSGDDVKIHRKATWSDGSVNSVVLGDPSSNDGITQNDGFSPWIVTENGLAYSVNADSKIKKGTAFEDTCGSNADLYHADLDNTRKSSNLAACLVVAVDINGLNKGPNEFYNKPVTETDANGLIEYYDRFYIYVTLDGVSTGPFKSAASGSKGESAYIEYWLHK